METTSDKKYRLILQPWDRDGQPAYARTVFSGDFSDRLIAERALAGALATGKFAGGTIEEHKEVEK